MRRWVIRIELNTSLKFPYRLGATRSNEKTRRPSRRVLRRAYHPAPAPFLRPPLHAGNIPEVYPHRRRESKRNYRRSLCKRGRSLDPFGRLLKVGEGFLQVLAGASVPEIATFQI